MTDLHHLPPSNKKDRIETLKYLEDLNLQTEFQTLDGNYLEQLRSVLNYANELTIRELKLDSSGSDFNISIGNTSDNILTQVDKEKIIKEIFDKLLKLGYRINTQDDDYTLTHDDFDGRTIIRANKNGNQVITITKPTDEFIGKAIVIRKTNGDIGTFVSLVTSEGVTISPIDSTPIRRIGSAVTLVYIGNGLFDVFGELP